MNATSTTATSSYRVTGTDPEQLEALRRSGFDHHGLAFEPFVDDVAGSGGGWPLRCCLTDSRPGDRLAIVAWSPFPWGGAYAMTGPVVIHADRCPSAPDQATHCGSHHRGSHHCGTAPAGALPAAFEQRSQILRAYDGAHLQVYDLARLVEPGQGLSEALTEILAYPRADLVQSFNVLHGCWSFTARREG